MKRKGIILLVLLLSILQFNIDARQFVKVEGDNVYISAKIDSVSDIVYNFRRCMFNNIFTFYSVGLVENSEVIPISNFEKREIKILNCAISDNIGPFCVENGGWAGANHSYKDENLIPTASCRDYNVIIDGKSICCDTLAYTDNISFKVENIIFNPLVAPKECVFGDTLCIEQVGYKVNKGSIEVSVNHKYCNKYPVTISKYYGMQSMFNGESEILTPFGKYSNWTPIKDVDQFKKKDYPEFSHFIEKSDIAFQSSYLLSNALGRHNEVNDEDLIFIGNSYSKSYHRLLGNSVRKSGDEDSWTGIYTWFTAPLFSETGALAFMGVVDGKEAIFFSCQGAGDYRIALSNKLIDRIKGEKSLNIERCDNYIIVHSQAEFNGYIVLK
ncbi:MAG: hypothetical protein PHR45_01350 [Muribaculaceae bacterium]|nr:hypothetical protein [Muribaculaceae bacterium]